MTHATLATPLTHLGRYAIDAELGRGAMGMVFKAHDPLIERTVAIKTVACGGLSRDEVETFERRFFLEAKSAGRLNHPNIVTIYDVGRDGGLAYIAMEYLEGQTLRDVLDSGVVLGADRIADIAAQVADGLAFAHANGVVHRDIKPANVMLLDNDVVKIADFGAALLPTGSLTHDGTVIGSPKYMSPEQVTGQSVDGRSDIFSLGAVLFEMLTGLPPFSGDDLGAILHQVINTVPPLPSSHRRNLDPGFDIIVAKAMAKNPDERYPNAADMALDLRRYHELGEPGEVAPRKIETVAADSPATVELPATTGTKSQRPRGWGWGRGWIAGAVATVAVAVIAFKVRHQTEAQLTTPAVVAQKAGESAAAKLAVAGKPPAAPTAAKLADPATQPVAPVHTISPAKAIKPDNATQPTAPNKPNKRTKPTKSAKTTKPAAPVRTTATTKPVKATKAQRTNAPAAAPAVTPAANARLEITVSPSGEIYVDNTSKGISPPLHELLLTPGPHVIEIRNSRFPSHKETVVLTTRESVRINHQFSAPEPAWPTGWPFSQTP